MNRERAGYIMAVGDIWIYRYREIFGTNCTTTWAPELITPFGRKFAEGRIELSRKERTVNARLVVDIINTKKRPSSCF